VRSTFDDALSHFNEGSIDLLHIDGLHTYEAVRHDYQSWLPKLSADAVVLFHDTNVRERDFGVFRLWSEIAPGRRHFSFLHGHGLGVLGHGQNYPAALNELFDATRDDSLISSTIREIFSEVGRSVGESVQKLSHDQSRSQNVRDLGKLQQALTILGDRLSECERELVATTNELEALRKFMTAVRRSRSWRLTAPLRLAGRLVRGEFGLVAETLRSYRGTIPEKWPLRALSRNTRRRNGKYKGIVPLVDTRCALTRKPLLQDPLMPRPLIALPAIDISVVTFNSQSWIKGFVESLLALNYDRKLLTIVFVDNASTDGTVADLQSSVERLRLAGLSAELLRCPNRGFGAGHNAAIVKGRAPFCLITNIDLTFEPDSLACVAAIAAADNARVAAWELRQKPYEHPKFYDPITGETNWNSHACVLLRRKAFEQVGGYDDTLFMYGEDVELSYRLRRAGATLRYCPKATVNHFTYRHTDQVKPLQYIGSTFANLYLRLKYGTLSDISKIPRLAASLLINREVFPGSRQAAARSLLKLTAVLPRAITGRARSNALFQFLNWDYDLVRHGAFVNFTCMSSNLPLVSIITRTYRGRELFLRQALLSVAHQTYQNIEYIVVEDGGDTMISTVKNMEEVTNFPVRFIGLEKSGRSKVGNAGLAVARGLWCLFLDDDDLLFADHIETLINALQSNPHAAAAYSLAWEVVTDMADVAEGSYRELTYRVPPVFFQQFDFEALMHHNYMPIQSVLFRRRLFEERGGFCEDMDALEDWNLWIRYAYENQFLYVPRVTSLFRTPACRREQKKRCDAFEKAYPIAVARANVCAGGNMARLTRRAT
jgi:GT2 family glycosyltransferase